MTIEMINELLKAINMNNFLDLESSPRLINVEKVYVNSDEYAIGIFPRCFMLFIRFNLQTEIMTIRYGKAMITGKDRAVFVDNDPRKNAITVNSHGLFQCCGLLPQYDYTAESIVNMFHDGLESKLTPWESDVITLLAKWNRLHNIGYFKYAGKLSTIDELDEDVREPKLPEIIQDESHQNSQMDDDYKLPPLITDDED